MDKKYIQQHINQFQTVNKEHKILDLCKGKNVLNVGCVGQDKFYESENWQHRKIEKVSNQTIGVDIQKEGILKLRDLGYNVVLDTELDALNEKFDVIVMSDVIEHVNNPYEFLSFYADYLSEEGKMLVSTPNAFHFARFIWILLWKNYSVNEEHTLWYCPLTFSELISRTKLQINDLYWCEDYFDIKTLNIRYRWIYKLSRFLAKSRKNLSPNFMMVLAKK